jgi:hypothetical protein
MRKLFPLLAVVAVVLFMAQSKSTPIKTGDTPVNTWTSANGALFDGGLAVGAVSGTGADTISTNECEARLVAVGYDAERSPVVSVVDDTSGLFSTPTRMIGLQLEWVAMNGSAAEVSFNQTPLVYAAWWRAFAGGDGGMPWFYMGSFSVTGSGGPTSRALMRISNAGTMAFGPGLWCFVPFVTGSGVHTVYQRVNKISAPVDQPR